MTEKNIFCDICGRTKKEHKKTSFIVTDESVNPHKGLCSHCIAESYNLIKQLESFTVESTNIENNKKDVEKTDITPREIFARLEDYIIGQSEAKKTLAIAIYNHYKRLEINKQNTDMEIKKSNILMLGSTGTGKTLLAQTLAKTIDVPFAIADATTITETGYVGEDVEHIIAKLVLAADGDIEKAQRGIIYLDEIDKIARKGESSSSSRDVSGEGVQQALLKLIEGTLCSVPDIGQRKHPGQKMTQIDTSNILFICGGAFDGIEKIISQRGEKGSIGFSANIKNPNDNEQLNLDNLEAHDIVKFGLIPELVGRLPVVTTLKTLEVSDLIRILTEPKNAIIKEKEAFFNYHNIKLTFTEEALTRIAEIAIERKTGARGLRTIVDKSLQDIMFDLPDMINVHEITVTKGVIDDNQTPLISLKKQA